MRDDFFEYLSGHMQNDKNIIILSNDYGSPKLDMIKNKFPDRFINCGITEQNIISVSAGLASRGMKPIIYSISTFITLRCFEQLKLDISVMELPVLILSVGAGYAYSMDGPTHHAIDDISILNTLNNCEIYSPSESLLFLKKKTLNFKFKGLRYYRLDRGKFFYMNDFYKIKNENFRVNIAGYNCVIISTGYMSQKISFEIYSGNINGTSHIDLYRIKPIDITILTYLRKFKKVIIIEEHIKPGGLFSILNDLITSNNIKIKIISLSLKEESSYNYGEREYLHKLNNIDICTVKKFI